MNGSKAPAQQKEGHSDRVEPMRERARPGLRAAAATLVAALLLPGSAYAQEPEPFESGFVKYAAASFDVLILRPFGLAALAVGTAAFIPAALLTVPNGKDGLRAASELFVLGPAENVFQRPLGDF